MVSRAAFKAILTIFFGLFLVCVARTLENRLMFGQWSFWLMTIPIIFYVYLVRTGADRNGLITSYSPVAGSVSMASFLLVLAFPVAVGKWLHLLLLLLGTGAGLLTFIRFGALRRHMAAHGYATRIAMAGGLSGLACVFTHLLLWKAAATATANMVYLFLHNFLPHMSVFEKGHRLIYGIVPHAPFHRFHKMVHVQGVRRLRYTAPPPPKPPGPPPDPHTHMNFMAVASDHTMLRFYIFENVLNGMFLLLFILCIGLLVTGKRLNLRQFLFVSGGGMLGIFFINAIVMTLIFLLAAATRTPGAGEGVLMLGKLVGAIMSQPLCTLIAYMVVIMPYTAWALAKVKDSRPGRPVSA